MTTDQGAPIGDVTTEAVLDLYAQFKEANEDGASSNEPSRSRLPVARHQRRLRPRRVHRLRTGRRR